MLLLEPVQLLPGRPRIERYDLTGHVSVPNNWRMTRLPPLETLRVFEVACRHGSYSEAARELHVTHSAVSQRIRQLEEELGLTLFERQGNRMVPTSSGLRLQGGSKALSRNWVPRSAACRRVRRMRKSPSACCR